MTVSALNSVNGAKSRADASFKRLEPTCTYEHTYVKDFGISVPASSRRSNSSVLTE